MALSLPNDLPDDYNYIAVGEGQFRIKEVAYRQKSPLWWVKWIHSTVLLTVEFNQKQKWTANEKCVIQKGKEESTIWYSYSNNKKITIKNNNTHYRLSNRESKKYKNLTNKINDDYLHRYCHKNQATELSMTHCTTLITLFMSELHT